jgi:hypothetical protein
MPSSLVTARVLTGSHNMFDHRTNIRKCSGASASALALGLVMAACPGHLVIASEAKQSSAEAPHWIASSLRSSQ